MFMKKRLALATFTSFLLVGSLPSLAVISPSPDDYDEHQHKGSLAKVDSDEPQHKGSLSKVYFDKHMYNQYKDSYQYSLGPQLHSFSFQGLEILAPYPGCYAFVAQPKDTTLDEKVDPILKPTKN